MRSLQRSMAISALAIVIFTVGISYLGKSSKGASNEAQDVLDTPVDNLGSDSADAIAKSKIEILRNQQTTDSAASNVATPKNSLGSSSADGKSSTQERVFDASQAASQTLSRLIATRKCERLSGALVPGKATGNQSTCPTNHPLALSTASGYSDLLVTQTVHELAFLKQLAIYARTENQADPFNLAQVAKVYIQHSDDNVKEQALEIAALVQARDGKEALYVATKAVESTVSGPLALQALALLSLHRDHDPRLVDKTVTSALKNAGWEVRDAVASQLLPFITPSTRPEFAQILASEPVRSKVALHIRLSLEEFDRMERL